MQKEEQLSLFPVGRKYWWLNDESLAVLNRGYLLHGETVEDAVKRITVRASEVLKKPELQPIFEEMIANGWLSLSSPIWANMGTKRGINIACFGSYVTDEIEGITDKLSEVIMQTKIGGGTSGYFGELRGRGASITNNGNSSGAVSFMELFNTAMNVVSQGCFTEDTEIFTNEGFKPIKEVVESKKYKLPTILQSIDKINLNELYWKDYEKPLEYFDYTYKDYLYSISFKKDGEIITLCTKDHKILLLKPNGEKLFITIENLEKDFDKYQNYYLAVQLEMSFHSYPLNLFIVKREDFYEGRVYCVETSNNILLAKYKNSTPLYIGNSTRRGSFAAYLDIDHPDIEEFLQIKDIGHPIQNLFYGVCVPDYWLHEMINGDSKKRNLWAKVLESRQQKGLPYIFFTDNVNKGKPEIYKYLDMKIHNSNLCVAGTDRLVSNYGYLTAEELYNIGTELTLFDGNKEVKSSPVKLRQANEKTYKIILENGMEHTITDYHKLNILNKYYKEEQKSLKDLKIGDRVVIQINKGLFGQEDNSELAYLLGWYQSDGTQNKDRFMIDVWENSFDKLEEIQSCFNKIYSDLGGNTYQIKNQFGITNGVRNIPTPIFRDCKQVGSQKKKRLCSNIFNKVDFKKGYIPEWLWRSNEKTQWKYIQGLLEADGSVYISSNKKSGYPIQLNYSDISLSFLKELQLLFNNLGLNSKIYLLRKGGTTLLPDGKGNKKYYKTKDCYRLCVNNKKDCLEIEKNTGFLTRKGISLKNYNFRDNTKKYSKIKNIVFSGLQDVYCPTVYSEEHSFICNGVKTVNCSEIALPTSKDESFVCCLAAMNLELYDEWKDTKAVQYAIWFLDAVLSDFIENTKDQKHLQTARNFAIRHRAIGLGTLALASYYQKIGRPFGHPLNIGLNNAIFSHIRSEAEKASRDLAREYGVAPIFKEVGPDFPESEKKRNTTLMTIAP